MPHCAGTGPSPTPARHPTSFRAPLLGVALALAGGVRRKIVHGEPAGPASPGSVAWSDPHTTVGLRIRLCAVETT